MTVAKHSSRSIALFGATGTIGRATAQALVEAGHTVTCFVRPSSKTEGLPETARVQRCEIDALTPADLAGTDAVVSCIASRTGAPQDAWRVDHDAHVRLLALSEVAKVAQFVLLSAICVQKPKLAFQRAKLAFEAKLQASPISHSIVRPTAYFKSLSGQVERVRQGKPFLLFGDGTLTACKPISDRDLGRYMALCLTDPEKRNAILSIGGPGPAITPQEQGQMIFDALGQEAAFKRVPVALMDGIIGVLKAGGVISARLRDKAELAKIGRYYATESMLLWDGSRYDAEATPSFGEDTLFEHYRALIAGDVAADLGDHAVF